MWTITAFMRAYVAQPTVPTARPIAATTSTTAPVSAVAPATPDADPSRPIPAIVEARATTTDARSSDVNAKGDRLLDSASNAPSGDPNVAAAAVAEQTPATAPTAAQPPMADKLAVQSAPEPVAPASGAGPNTAPTLAAQPAPAAADAAAEPSPSSEPIAGPIPLPRHRPNVIALAETGVPLPRARPASAPEPTSGTMSDAPRSGYDPAMGHY
jgi:hypothetical protein